MNDKRFLKKIGSPSKNSNEKEKVKKKSILVIAKLFALQENVKNSAGQ